MKSNKLNRDEISELRHVAILALKAALPKLRAAHIAQALKIDISTITFHLSARYKGRKLGTEQAWQSQLENGCRAIAEGNFELARRQLAAVCYALTQVEEKTKNASV